MAKLLGRLLRDKRESRYLSLPEVELATRIKAEYLRALEEGRFDDLPGETYVEIYLREYARYLDLDPEPMLERFHQQMRWPRFWQRFGRNLRSFWQKHFLTVFLGVLLIGLGAVLVWVLLFGRQPEPAPPPPTPRVEKHLTLVYPQDGVTVISPEIILVGEIPAGAKVTVNGEPAQPQADGHFTYTVALAIGETRFQLRAWDDTGWSEEIEGVVFRPAPTPLPTLSPATRDEAQMQYEVVVNQIDVTHYPDMVAYFSVFDPLGEPWPALTIENLAVEEEGQDIDDFFMSTVPPTEPVAVALVVDVSESMAGEPLTQAQEALRIFVENLGAEDTASLISFNENVTLLQGFTSDKGVLTNTVGTLRALGNTALNDAIYFGVEQVATQPFARRAVIVLTDGNDTASTARTLEEAIGRAGLLNIPVYALGLRGEGFDEEPLQRLARETGAVYLPAPDASALGELYARLNRQLQGQYRVIYQSPGAGGEAHSLTLTTRINGVVRQSSKSYRVP